MYGVACKIFFHLAPIVLNDIALTLVHYTNLKIYQVKNYMQFKNKRTTLLAEIIIQSIW